MKNIRKESKTPLKEERRNKKEWNEKEYIKTIIRLRGECKEDVCKVNREYNNDIYE